MEIKAFYFIGRDWSQVNKTDELVALVSRDKKILRLTGRILNANVDLAVFTSIQTETSLLASSWMGSCTLQQQQVTGRPGHGTVKNHMQYGR